MRFSANATAQMTYSDSVVGHFYSQIDFRMENCNCSDDDKFSAATSSVNDVIFSTQSNIKCRLEQESEKFLGRQMMVMGAV